MEARATSPPSRGPDPALARVVVRSLLELGYHEHVAVERLVALAGRTRDGGALDQLWLQQLVGERERGQQTRGWVAGWGVMAACAVYPGGRSGHDSGACASLSKGADAGRRLGRPWPADALRLQRAGCAQQESMEEVHRG